VLDQNRGHAAQRLGRLSSADELGQDRHLLQRRNCVAQVVAEGL